VHIDTTLPPAVYAHTPFAALRAHNVHNRAGSRFCHLDDRSVRATWLRTAEYSQLDQLSGVTEPEIRQQEKDNVQHVRRFGHVLGAAAAGSGAQ